MTKVPNNIWRGSEGRWGNPDVEIACTQAGVDRWRDRLRLYLTGDDSATGGPSLQNAFKGHSLSSEPSEISKPITASNVYLMTWRTKCACNCMSRCESEFTDCDTCIHHHLHLIPIASTARIAYWSGPRLLSWSPRRSHRSRYTVLSQCMQYHFFTKHIIIFVPLWGMKFAHMNMKYEICKHTATHSILCRTM